MGSSHTKAQRLNTLCNLIFILIITRFIRNPSVSSKRNAAQYRPFSRRRQDVSLKRNNPKRNMRKKTGNETHRPLFGAAVAPAGQAFAPPSFRPHLMAVELFSK